MILKIPTTVIRLHSASKSGCRSSRVGNESIASKSTNTPQNLHYQLWNVARKDAIIPFDLQEVDK